MKKPIPSEGGAVPTTGLSPSLFSLIAAYWQCYDKLDTAMRHTDSFDYDTPEREAAYREQFEAGQNLDEAMFAVCEFVPHFRGDARTKTQFITLVTEMESGPICEQILKALLKSLPNLVHFSANSGSATA